MMMMARYSCLVTLVILTCHVSFGWCCLPAGTIVPACDRTAPPSDPHGCCPDSFCSLSLRCLPCVTANSNRVCVANSFNSTRCCGNLVCDNGVCRPPGQITTTPAPTTTQTTPASTPAPTTMQTTPAPTPTPTTMQTTPAPTPTPTTMQTTPAPTPTPTTMQTTPAQTTTPATTPAPTTMACGMLGNPCTDNTCCPPLVCSPAGVCSFNIVGRG